MTKAGADSTLPCYLCPLCTPGAVPVAAVETHVQRYYATTIDGRPFMARSGDGAWVGYDQYAMLASRLRAVEAEREALRAALLEYGDHGLCKKTDGYGDACTCGWDAARAALSTDLNVA